ncbi:MAG: glycogen/starch synthase [Candidatus Neomarinimicrobiota bacterium]|nr:glycogen/starch synthase [Candidatus Neomarinimicrobiota bacterium]
MAKKIFYITSEMKPFASISSLSDYSSEVPLSLQSKGNDVRCLMPKYGFISERKYILREVIRLKEIFLNFGDSELVCSAKSAFLPKSRLQVYFLEEKGFFGELNNLLYKSKNGRFLTDNDKRFAFYCLASIKMLPNLFWYPNIIICNGWTSALIPLLLNILSKENKALAKIKSIYLTNSLNEDIIFDSKNIGLQDETISSIKSLNLNQIGCMFADKTIIINGEKNKISSKLMKLKIFKDSKKCSVVDLSGDDEVDYSPLFDKIDRTIKVL